MCRAWSQLGPLNLSQSPPNNAEISDKNLCALKDIERMLTIKQISDFRKYKSILNGFFIDSKF
jgi:hypothetical protein